MAQAKENVAESAGESYKPIGMPRRDLLEDNGVSTVHVEGSPTQAC
jgi:hypothetical protein